VSGTADIDRFTSAGMPSYTDQTQTPDNGARQFGARFEPELCMSATKAWGGWLRRMFEQQKSLREQWDRRNGVPIEDGRAVDRVHEERPHPERRRFRSDAQLRAERQEDKQEWLSSSPSRKREDAWSNF
jgi:hypothetical protein